MTDATCTIEGCDSNPNWQAKTTRHRVGYRYVLLPDHPLAMASGEIAQHRVILYAKIGPADHPCHWCSLIVSWSQGHNSRSLIPDHLDGDRGNNDCRNLVPSCNACNMRRSPRYHTRQVVLPPPKNKGQRMRRAERVQRREARRAEILARWDREDGGPV